ncbi:unnamed protein product [Moneuplotes crassus]|uniref:Uncharacterized protein n=1 Tax=Euplotes crassus TaxID=5936 RepID=A0AAD1Y2D3_EUPCR|nr:unnamed protein product [Moneuplotes crassus]
MAAKSCERGYQAKQFAPKNEGDVFSGSQNTKGPLFAQFLCRMKRFSLQKTNKGLSIMTHGLESTICNLTNDLIQYCKEQKGVLEEQSSKVSQSNEFSHRCFSKNREANNRLSKSSNLTGDDFKSVDSRLSMSLKMSSYQRKEVLEEFLDIRDSLKIIFNIVIDEVWKYCHKSINAPQIPIETPTVVEEKKVNKIKKITKKNKIILNKNAFKQKLHTDRPRNCTSKPKFLSSKKQERLSKFKRTQSRSKGNSRNAVNQSMRNFETQYVTIDLKDMDKSTFQSTILKEQSSVNNEKFNSSPANMVNNKLKESSGVSLSTKVSPRKFLECQNNPDKPDLSIDADLNSVKDSPVRQFIYDSLRSKEGIHPEIFSKKTNCPKKAPQSNFNRNFSKESDMCAPMSCNESAEENKDVQRISFEEKIDYCAKLANEVTNENFDIRQQLFKAFGYNQADEEFYISRRRGAVGEDLTEYGNNNRILHVRQSWNPNREITPTSSIQTSEFSKWNKQEDSEISSEKNMLDSFKKNNDKKESKSSNQEGIEKPKKMSNSPKVMQKVFNTLSENPGLTEIDGSQSNLKKNALKKESFDIISKAREACDKYLKLMEGENSPLKNVEKLLNPNDEEEVEKFCKTVSKNNLAPYLEPVEHLENSRRSRYQEYLVSEDDCMSSEKRSFLNSDNFMSIFEDQQVRQGGKDL